MSNDVVNLDDIKRDLANIPKGVDDDTRAVAGSGMYNKRISIKGGTFRKMVGGKEVGKNDERHMNIVFVKMAHNPSRTYYVDAYREGAKAAPLCWSSDSKAPDPEVSSPQASSCNDCKFSVKGSSQNGQGSACRLSWRTAVVLPNDPSGDVMQLVLPATSIWGTEEPNKLPFKAYVRYLAGHNISAGRVVTRMAFDTAMTAPTVRFSAVSAVPAGDIDTIVKQGQSPAAEAAIKMTVFQQDEAEVPAVAAPAEVKIDAEPVLRKSEPEAAQPTADVSEIVKKWSRKAKA